MLGWSDSAAGVLCIPVDGVSQPFCPCCLWQYLETHLEWLGRIWWPLGWTGGRCRADGMLAQSVIVSVVRASPRNGAPLAPAVERTGHESNWSRKTHTIVDSGLAADAGKEDGLRPQQALADRLKKNG